MSDLLDVAEFQACLVGAVTKSFGDLINRFSGDTFYGFALFTTDDLAGVVPSASTERGFEQRKQELLADQDRLTWLAQKNIDLQEVIDTDCRWSVYNWEHECHLADAFSPAGEMLRVAADRTPSDSERIRLTGVALAAMVVALRRVELDGLFAKVEDRASFTLLCSKPCSSDTDWLEKESAFLLNPRRVSNAFKRQRFGHIEDDGRWPGPTEKQFHRAISQSVEFRRRRPRG